MQKKKENEMSITTRLFSDCDLENIKTGKDNFLATIFLNVGIYNEKEIKVRHVISCSTYIVFFANDETVVIYATDRENCISFVKAEYNWDAVESIDEKFIAYNNIYTNYHEDCGYGDEETPLTEE
jgi:hypothetical protein